MLKNSLPYYLLFTLVLTNTSPSIATANYAAFSMVDKNYDQIKDETSVKNLPRTYSQDTFGNCYAMSSGYILDATNCRTQKVKCSELPDTYSFSRLDLSRYGNDVPKEAQFKRYFTEIQEGGSSNAIIENVFVYKMGAASQKCASLDKLLVNFGDSFELKKAQQKSWSMLRDTYDKFKSQKANCPTCQLDITSTAQSEILQNFNINRSNSEILAAFAADTYEKFLDKLMIPKECHNSEDMIYLEDTDKLSLKFFPEDPRKISNYDDNIAAIKSALSKRAPIAVNGVCLGDDFDAKVVQKKYLASLNQGDGVKSSAPNKSDQNKYVCSEPHSVAISGYRKICKKDKPNECRETLKIENSWGESWQKQNNDGWVDAKSFLDRTAYLGQNLLWIEDKATN